MNRFEAVLVAALGSSLVVSNPAAEPHHVDDFAWLVGTWTRASTSGTVQETWRPLNDATLEGASYVIHEEAGTKRQDEWMLLAYMDGTLYYITKPKQNPLPVAFKLVRASADGATFENLTHDFPQRIIYKREGESKMTVTIEGPGKDDETNRIHFSFTRLEE